MPVAVVWSGAAAGPFCGIRLCDPSTGLLLGAGITLIPHCLAGLWALVQRSSLQRPFPCVFQSQTHKLCLNQEQLVHFPILHVLICHASGNWNTICYRAPFPQSQPSANSRHKELQACLSSLTWSKTLETDVFVGSVHHEGMYKPICTFPHPANVGFIEKKPPCEWQDLVSLGLVPEGLSGQKCLDVCAWRPLSVSALGFNSMRSARRAKLSWCLFTKEYFPWWTLNIHSPGSETFPEH